MLRASLLLGGLACVVALTAAVLISRDTKTLIASSVGTSAGATGYDPAVTSLTVPDGGTIYHDTPQTKTVEGTVKNEGANADTITITFRAEYALDFEVSWIGEAGDTVQNNVFCGGGPCFFYSELTYVETGIDPEESLNVSRDLVLACPNPSFDFLKSYNVTLSAGSANGDDNPTDSSLTGSQNHTCVAENPNADPDGDTIGNGADTDDDNDSCPDVSEAQTAPGTELSGGRRNKFNPNDYFNPSGDGLNRVDDVLLVVQAYFADDDDANPGLPPYEPGYNPDYDRTLLGPLDWNLGPPNGLQRVDDILNSLKQYFHDCS